MHVVSSSLRCLSRSEVSASSRCNAARDPFEARGRGVYSAPAQHLRRVKTPFRLTICHRPSVGCERWRLTFSRTAIQSQGSQQRRDRQTLRKHGERDHREGQRDYEVMTG